MKAEEKRNTAEAALSMRVDNLQKCYTDLGIYVTNERSNRADKGTEGTDPERSRKDEGQQETATKADERNTAEAALKAETRAEEKRIDTLTGMVIEGSR
eukprot:5720520-Heterocapsa_arctica.AAC.1